MEAGSEWEFHARGLTGEEGKGARQREKRREKGKRIRGILLERENLNEKVDLRRTRQMKGSVKASKIQTPTSIKRYKTSLPSIKLKGGGKDVDGGKKKGNQAGGEGANCAQDTSGIKTRSVQKGAIKKKSGKGPRIVKVPRTI